MNSLQILRLLGNRYSSSSLFQVQAIRVFQSRFHSKPLTKEKSVQRKKENKERRRQEAKVDLLTDEQLNRTSYFSEDGYRKVYPFMDTFSMKITEKYAGRTVEEVFINKFKYEPDILENALSTGRIKRNGSVPCSEQGLYSSDILTVTLHKHERPVLDLPIEIIEDNDDVLVVNKPHSIPMYPTGKYCFNSLNYIIAKEYGYKCLRSVHRLDRTVSGVVIFAKSQVYAHKLISAWDAKDTDKIYLSRVHGEFPSGIVECRAPLARLCTKLGFVIVDDVGKSAYSTFQRISFDGTTSLVKCQIHTGRTHQVRVHLQYLGHPVLHDKTYNNDGWGPERGKGGVYHKTGQELKLSVYNALNKLDEIPNFKASEICSHQTQLPPFDQSKMTTDSQCPYCMKSKPIGADNGVIFLHKLRSKGTFWDYSTPLPHWAREEWQS